MRTNAENLLSKVEKKYNGDIFASNRNESCYVFEKYSVISQERIQSDQMALRIVGDNNIGYSTASGYYDSDEMLNNALKTFKYNTEQCKMEDYNCCFTKTVVQIYDSQIENIDYLFIQNVKKKIREIITYVTAFSVSNTMYCR